MSVNFITMTKKSAYLVLCVAILLLSGCGMTQKVSEMTHRVFTGSDDASNSNASNPDAKELTGMLQIVDADKCPLVEGCGPVLSLLGRNLKSQIAIMGDIPVEQDKLVLTVTGIPGPLSDELSGKSGYERIKASMTIDGFRVRSKIPYYPFLVDQATAYTTEKFGCDLLWDKSYSWTIENEEAQLMVRMTNTTVAEPQPWVELAYNGDSGAFISVASEPANINPCEQ
jgi:hypothetical protein